MTKSADGFDVKPHDTVYVELFCAQSNGPRRAILDDECNAIIGSLLAPRFFVKQFNAARAMLAEAAAAVQKAELDKRQREREYARLYILATSHV